MKEQARFDTARCERMEMKAARERIALDVMTGHLVEWAVIEKLQFARERQVRDGVLNIPSRVTGLLVALCPGIDQATMHAILTKECRQCLQALAR